MEKGGLVMRQTRKVKDFVDKLEFQGYIASPIQVESELSLNPELPCKTWINIRGIPIMRLKDVLKLLGVREHPILTQRFIEKNNKEFFKKKHKRPWIDSRRASYRDELVLLRSYKKDKEQFVDVELNVLVESASQEELEVDSKFIQDKLFAARLSAIETKSRRKKDTRLPLVITIKRQKGDDIDESK